MQLRCALDFVADFADLFEIRGHVRSRRGGVTAEVRGPAEVVFAYRALDAVPRSTRIVFDPAPAALSPARADFAIDVEPRSRRSIAVAVQCLQADQPASPAGFHATLRRARRARARGRAQAAKIETSNVTVNSVLSRSSAVMMPSRPNAVENQGTPAYG